MRYQGRITDWKDDQAFGFITPNGGGPRVFVHVKSFANRQQRPVGSERVTYELTHDARGRPQAGNVAFVGRTAPGPSRRSNAPVILAAAFIAFVAGSAYSGRLPIAVAWVYAVASLVAFVAYARDKSAARSGRWRTAESTLHLFALAGGWPGALAAQRLLRHKTRKQPFQAVFWITVILNCGALAWAVSTAGGAALRAMLNAA